MNQQNTEISIQENGVQQKTNWSYIDYIRSLGPGTIVAAGIIGPGTVTTMSVMGATYRYEAMWILLLGIIVAYFFQEPAIRITLGTNLSVMEGVRQYISPFASVFLYIAVLMGTIAFQAGNFIGAAMALNYFVPGMSLTLWAATMAIAALVIAWVGVYKILENVTMVLIGLMSVSFILTAFVSGPSIGELFTEGFRFTIPGGDYWLLIALVATTLPPQIALALSVFLKKKYVLNPSGLYSHNIKLARFDLRTNMILMAVMVTSILISAGAVIHGQGIIINSAADMSVQLTPLLGRYAGVLFALGLWGAGFTSGLYQLSIQPPLMNQAFGWEEDVKARRSRGIILFASITPIIIIFAFQGTPVPMIIAAQALNGLALPLVAGLILLLCNKKSFLGNNTNTNRQNIIYSIITILVTFLALRVFLNLLGAI